jgi:hypothetical protein
MFYAGCFLVYSWTSEPRRLHHALCRQPCGWKVLGLQRDIPYEVSRDRHRHVGWPNYCGTIANIEEIFIIIMSLNNISLRQNEEPKKLRKLIRNKLTRKQEQCACYFCWFFVNLKRCVTLPLWQHESCLLWGRDFYRIKNSLFFFPLAHEYRKFVENRIYWSVVTFGGWRIGVRHQLATISIAVGIQNCDTACIVWASRSWLTFLV